jgi:AcrR family transcriptional regulator
MTALASLAAERRRCYHLGNARGELLMAARDILEARGKAALSLRAISLRAGVALGTIYHHYASKHALLAWLAVEGFEELTRRMRQALETRGEGRPIRAVGLAYVAFLTERPALYQLMFEEIDQGRQPEVLAAEAAAIQVIGEAVASVLGTAAQPDAAEPVALAIWAWGRGVAAFGFSRGAPGGPPQQAAVAMALRGLEGIFVGSWAPAPAD